MPILDGYEATKQIRDYIHSQGLPQPVIIAITGHTEDSYVRKAYSSGMNGIS
jgi:CheY-like chemotaxis protein